MNTRDLAVFSLLLFMTCFAYAATSEAATGAAPAGPSAISATPPAAPTAGNPMTGLPGVPAPTANSANVPPNGAINPNVNAPQNVNTANPNGTLNPNDGSLTDQINRTTDANNANAGRVPGGVDPVTGLPLDQVNNQGIIAPTTLPCGVSGQGPCSNPAPGGINPMTGTLNPNPTNPPVAINPMTGTGTVTNP